MPICRLCELEMPKLRDSHIVSKWLYKQIRERSARGKPDPVYLHGGRAVQTSKQFKEHLLCGKCEDLIGRSERYVSLVAYRTNGDCPLYKTLGFRSSVRSLPHLEPPVVLRAVNVDVDKLVRFAASVFWRASVSLKVEDFKLDANSQERLRSYLLGRVPFPMDMALLLSVYDQPRNPPEDFLRFDRIGTLPVSAATPSGTLHEFLGAGLHFSLWTGELEEDLARASLPVSGLVGFFAANHHPITNRILSKVSESRTR